MSAGVPWWRKARRLSLREEKEVHVQTAENWGGLARLISQRADCTRRQIGAVVVTRDGRVVGVGWNGLTVGSCLGGDCPRGQFTHAEIPAGLGNSGGGKTGVPCLAVHAESAAIQMAVAQGADMGACTLVVTDTLCAECMPMVRDAGVSRVVVVPRDG